MRTPANCTMLINGGGARPPTDQLNFYALNARAFRLIGVSNTQNNTTSNGKREIITLAISVSAQLQCEQNLRCDLRACVRLCNMLAYRMLSHTATQARKHAKYVAYFERAYAPHAPRRRRPVLQGAVCVCVSDQKKGDRVQAHACEIETTKAHAC